MDFFQWEVLPNLCLYLDFCCVSAVANSAANIIFEEVQCPLDSDFLNQVHAGHKPAHAWFLKIVYVRTSVFVCVPTPEAINN